MFTGMEGVCSKWRNPKYKKQLFAGSNLKGQYNGTVFTEGEGFSRETRVFAGSEGVSAGARDVGRGVVIRI